MMRARRDGARRPPQLGAERRRAEPDLRDPAVRRYTRPRTALPAQRSALAAPRQRRARCRAVVASDTWHHRPTVTSMAHPPIVEKVAQASFDQQFEQHVQRGAVLRRGINGTSIAGYPYTNLPKSAQSVIYNVYVNGPGGDDSWFYFTDRDGQTQFGNRDGDLPASGPYREYTVIENDVLESGRLRLVHDETSGDFYFTPYHYGRKLRGAMHGIGVVQGPSALPPDLNNPFFLVTAMPTDKWTKR
jgi:guanyl-specific ribonuclease Sa